MINQLQTIEIHLAKKHLFKLVDEVVNGQEFILEDAGKPVARLIPFRANIVILKPGSMRGEIKIHDDFDVSLSLENLIEGKKE